MKITREEVRNVAMLARLELSGDEEAAFAEDLDRILTYVDMLDELDTTAIEPTAHVADIPTPFREDRVTNQPDTEALLAGAPAREGGYIKVPKIIE
jgi:aspartyl-tRNA(Asn)/glutamyl-tRNA(Gln) amidotransferase subunit C